MSRRLIYLSRLHIILFAFALLALVHRLDSADQQADLRGLDLLASVVGDADLQRLLDEGRLHGAALTWLENHDKATAVQNLAVRDGITRLLQEHGVSDEILVKVKGRSTPNANNYFRLIEIEIQEPLPNNILRFNIYTVNEVVSMFELWTHPRKLNVAVTLEEAILPTFGSFINEWTPELPLLQLTSVYLQEQTAIVVFEEDRWLSQQWPLTITDTLRVVTTPVNGPSLYTLRAGENMDVASLTANTELLDRLRQIYGNLRFDLAQQTVAEDFIRSYKSIDIFGFTVSTRRYPFAILLLAFISAWGIAWTVEDARRTGKRILRDIQEEDIEDVFLDLGLARLVIWTVLPVMGLLAALPLFPLGTVEQLILYAGMSVVALLGMAATLRARAL